MTQKKSLISRIFSISTSDNAVLYPLGKIVLLPYSLLAKGFRAFFGPAAIYALLISLLYLFTGQSMFCNFSLFSYDSICFYNPIMFIVTRIFVFYLIAAFCVRYYQTQWQNREPDWRFLIYPQRRDIISFFTMLILFLANFTALWSWKTLTVRVPNPNWKIELTYFAFVSLGFLVPLVLLRLYVFTAFIWSGNKPISLWKIWIKTQGNNLRLLISFCLWFFISMFLLSSISNTFSASASEAGWFTIFTGEYMFNFALLIVFGFFVNSCSYQKTILCKEKEND